MEAEGEFKAFSMDLSSYYTEDIDAISWLNISLESFFEKDKTTNYPDIESRLKEVLTRLEHDFQTWNSESPLLLETLKRTSSEVLNDLTTIEEQARTMQTENIKANRYLNRLETETSSGLGNITTLDMMIKRMEESRQALQEADNWNTLKAHIEHRLNRRSRESREIVKEDEELAVKIQEMERCLIVLQHIAGFEERKTLMAEYRERFMISMVEKISVAAEEMNSVTITQAQTLLNQIGCGDRFLKTFYKARQKALMKLWEEVKKERRTHEDWSMTISCFLDRLMLVLREERNFYAKIFSEPEKHLFECVGRFFDTSPKSFIEKELDQWSSGDSSQFVEQLLLVLEHLHKFVKQLCVEYILNVVGIIDVNGKAYRGWLHQVLSGFVRAIRNYVEFEERLVAEIEKSVFQKTRGAEEPIIRLRELLDTLFPELKISLFRCMTVTNGFLLDKWIIMCRETLLRLLDRFKRCVAELSFRLGLDENPKPGTEPTPKGPSTLSHRQQHSVEKPSEISVSEDRQWIFFEGSLKLIDFCNAFDNKFHRLYHEIEDQLEHTTQAIVETKTSLFPPVSSEGNTIDDSALDSIICMDILSPIDDLFLDKIRQEFHSSKECLKNNLLESTSIGQKLALHILYLIPKKNLMLLNQTAIWRPEEQRQEPFEQQIPSSQTSLPTFSLSPSNPVILIGEYLLMLPQQLELYSENEAFGYSLSALPYQESLVDDDTETAPITKRWLHSLCAMIIDDFMKRILQIHRLSQKGHRQLLTDMQYVKNIVSALNIRPNEKFILLQSLLSMSNEEIQTFSGLDLDATQRSILARVIEMLSISSFSTSSTKSTS